MQMKKPILSVEVERKTLIISVQIERHTERVVRSTKRAKVVSK